MQLSTESCVIREWRFSDKSDLVHIANNRNVWRNLSHVFPHPYTYGDAERWFLFLQDSFPVTHWAIEVDGRLAGGIGLFLGEGVYAKSARLGYWLGESFWGRGIATDVVRAVTEYAMPAYCLSRVESEVFAWNPASGRVLEKAGYTLEGVKRLSILKDGELLDAMLYAVTAKG